MSIILIGAGGHAKVVLEVLRSLSYNITGYIDPKVKTFYDIPKIEEIDFAQCVMGIGGVNPIALEGRNNLFVDYQSKGAKFLTLTSRLAYVSSSAVLAEGAFINHGAIVHCSSYIDKNVIINTRAIVEHDARIGMGTHIAPGAIILGGSIVGKSCMIGAGAVVLQGSQVPDGTLIPALTRFPKSVK